ncbi:MAG: excinuclease ABC subunit UvrA [Capsulimonadaceae bacterium]|nr:excinuclease ABC subunit UvrA [Capsulimonadaceae bacterium]
MPDFIKVTGARQNNLKNINVEIPRDKLVVITGLSGSGKSSLAFDTIYAEGQRRYVESLSAYARQFLGQMEKPDVEHIEGLSPAVAIDQKSTSKNPRSTVGTITEIYDYLRLLFARAGTPHCPNCGRVVASQTVEQMVDTVMALPEASRIQILAPLIKGRKGEYRKELDDLRKEGFVRLRIDGEMRETSEDIVLDKYKQHTIDVVLDRLIVKEGIDRRLADSLEAALKKGKGSVAIDVAGGEEMLFSENFACSYCGISIEEVAPRTFSFNSPYGACPDCHGLGVTTEFDPNRIIPNWDLSLREGAIAPYALGDGGTKQWITGLLEGVATRFGFTLDTKVREMTDEQRHALLYGIDGAVTISMRNRWGRTRNFTSDYTGIVGMLKKRQTETESENVKEWLAQYQTDKPCPSCAGKRLKPAALAVTIGDRNITDLTELSIEHLAEWFNAVEMSKRQRTIARQVIKEIQARLGFLLNVGLDYLTLSRAAATLAGGEAQRIRLATQIGSGLMGVLYILDEPSIGLHQRDNTKLIETLIRLRDLGNTVLVVEHDEEMMAAADWIIDMGPGAGEHGGEVVAEGRLETILASEGSLTGQYLSGREKIETPRERRTPGDRSLQLHGARGHNLKNVDVDIPLGLFVCITGVSGSGKSTLIQETLYPRLQSAIYRTYTGWEPHDSLEGIEQIDKIVDIDQSPIGRTPRSNPATYTGVFDMIRDLFSKTADSRMRGYKPGRFSFNVKGGRCEACKGEGIIKIEMHFLPDVFVPCEVCHGKRYNRETLEVKYKGKSIADVLSMTVGQSVEFFENVPAIVRKLRTIHDVGLDYIRLGQPATQLSGGEAQRIKLASELSKRATGKTLYILDEPTTGLHFADIKKLIALLQRLTSGGNTVIVIEHNLDVIKTADWLIDMGPEGGDRGGKIVAQGTPETVAQTKGSYTGQYLKDVLKGRSLLAGHRRHE